MKVRGLLTAAAIVAVLTPQLGRVQFNGHDETYYNLPMRRVVEIAQERGVPGEYWEDEETGCKMYGPFIIVAGKGSNTYGSIVETSLGPGIVLDTGEFPEPDIDIAVTW